MDENIACVYRVSCTLCAKVEDGRRKDCWDVEKRCGLWLWQWRTNMYSEDFWTMEGFLSSNILIDIISCPLSRKSSPGSGDLWFHSKGAVISNDCWHGQILEFNQEIYWRSVSLNKTIICVNDGWAMCREWLKQLLALPSFDQSFCSVGTSNDFLWQNLAF